MGPRRCAGFSGKLQPIESVIVKLKYPLTHGAGHTCTPYFRCADSIWPLRRKGTIGPPTQRASCAPHKVTANLCYKSASNRIGMHRARSLHALLLTCRWLADRPAHLRQPPWLSTCSLLPLSTDHTLVQRAISECCHATQMMRWPTYLGTAHARTSCAHDSAGPRKPANRILHSHAPPIPRTLKTPTHIPTLALRSAPSPSHCRTGTCVNVGCIPKKLFHQAGLLGEGFSDARGYGWKLPEAVPLGWEDLVQGVQNHIGSLNWGYRVALREASVKVGEVGRGDS